MKVVKMSNKRKTIKKDEKQGLSLLTREEKIEIIHIYMKGYNAKLIALAILGEL